ncbi:sensor histidine kinase [Pseudomonas frederiksbergensis]|uniref:sensor histidine kinase n=1 Tax=Pseudomonas frederiksbergensis TaxID=104087 RepID=UPI000A7BE4C9|nr:HAMP domain-containing sensor histidine kinase [Pseudomonas frederiksbergensis]
MQPGIAYNGTFHAMRLFKTDERPLAARMLVGQPLAMNLKAQYTLDVAQDTLRSQYAAAEGRALFAEQLIGIVSHDLRNPLAAITMASQLLGRRDLPPKQAQILGHITHAAERAQRLVADLLDFTLRQVGRGIAVSLKPVDLHTLVGECLDELSLVSPGHTLTHLCVGQGRFSADSDRLYQLIGNLVANAMAYGTAEGGITVSSRFEDQVIIAVHNSGTPIPSELLDDLFEPMIRGSHNNAQLRSVGLGLFIVREIVRAHHGDVGVTSSIEGGTTFTATFPLPR